MKFYQALVLVVLVTLLDISLAHFVNRRQAETESDERNDIPREDSSDADKFPGDDDEDDGGFSFSLNLNPFNPFEEMYKHLESTIKRLHDFMANATANIPDDYNNTSTDTVIIDGKKYTVRKTIVRKADNESELFVRAFSMVPADRKKRELTELE